MNQILVLTTLLSVCALSSAVGSNRYGAPHSGNSLSHRGGPVRYPAAPHSPRAPVHPSYGASRGHNYGVHQSAAPPAHYGGGRHLGAASAGLSHYNGPAPYGGPVHYGGQAAHASIPSHYSSSKRSVYQQPGHNGPAHNGPSHSGPSHNSRSGYAQPQTFSHSHHSAESKSQTSGREMKYTIKDPQNRGTTHVSETHVVSNRQMHGAEAEAAMKKLMGSMGPGSDNGGFQDLFKGMGLPFY